jgi:2,3-bisphosphoglycerate-independent phosphoglycerate mutase
MLITPDHPTFLRTKTHAHGYVPWAIVGSGVRGDGATAYDDPAAGRSELVFEDGWRLMERFIDW